MRQAERTGIAAQLRQARQELSVGAARKQRREQRILLRARRIDLVDAAGGLAIEKIGTQHRAADARRRLHRQHALGRNAIPVGDGGLRDADAARKLADAANGAESLPRAPDPASAYFLGAASPFELEQFETVMPMQRYRQ